MGKKWNSAVGSYHQVLELILAVGNYPEAMSLSWILEARSCLVVFHRLVFVSILAADNCPEVV